jgi:hypothetical protein
MFVHYCHCHWCKHETGASFALYAMFESDRAQNPGAKSDLVDAPSEAALGRKLRAI